MKLSELRSIKEELNDNLIDFRDFMDFITSDTDDFEVDNYRFIRASEIDEIQVEELKCNEYVLGCFNASFLADNTDLSFEIIEALQQGDKLEAIGKHIIDNYFINDIQQEYSRLDGYGHHFAHCDHEEHEITVNGVDYYYFKIN